ncbi:c-type cytochrome biogenesis protein CcsB [Synechococcus sp. PCC 7336]|uniref:c-type cytochrome biogenesis protein CcsB n=1 Tax=Synechococcus sp. PCC 7336 TaxID=195250 RepID=UPI0003489EFC|nr:c-type cytochrome biogenesis protein CcsB [Synechococcus sp. PCC 7336]
MDLAALQELLDNSAFAVLFAAMGLYWISAAFPRIPALQELGTAAMAIGNLSIASLLIARWIDAGYFPLSNLYESLFFLAWGVTTMHLVAEWMGRNRLVGVFTAPLAMGIVAFAAFSLPVEMQSSSPLVPALQSNWLMMHVSVMMFSYATLMVGSVLSIAFLVVTRGRVVELKGNSFGIGNTRSGRGEGASERAEGESEDSAAIGAATTNAGVAVLERSQTAVASALTPQKLSLAEVLDNLSYRLIGLGFPLLTIGIIAGGVWANEAWGTYWSWDPKETWALITWLVFAAYLHTRITKGWQGRRPAILASAGLVVVWVCYLGVNLLGIGLHSYGWFL